jgi:hypothetical protein
METETNGRDNEDDDSGNNKVLYLHTQKLDKYGAVVYIVDTQTNVLENR